MDASARCGTPVGGKTSSAYSPPQLAQARLTGGVVDVAAPSSDVWSVGAVLFEMCASRNLFAQDIANDELVDEADVTRLCTWDMISDEELEPVFGSAEMAEQIAAEPQLQQVVDDAKNLIRSCLQGEAAKRPTVAQILAHRFFSPGAPAPPPQPMQYHNFMSHAQADAAGIVGTVNAEYDKKGLHNWVDVRQQVLTVEGMRQGGRDSKNFQLVLTKTVVSRTFCRLEMQCAIDGGKTIQLLVEEDVPGEGGRFQPFDRAAWAALEAGMAGNAGVVEIKRREETSYERVERQDRGLSQPLGLGWVQTDRTRDLWARDERICRVPGSLHDGLPDAIRTAINAALSLAAAATSRWRP